MRVVLWCEGFSLQESTVFILQWPFITAVLGDWTPLAWLLQIVLSRFCWPCLVYSVGIMLSPHRLQNKYSVILERHQSIRGFLCPVALSRAPCRSLTAGAEQEPLPSGNKNCWWTEFTDRQGCFSGDNRLENSWPLWSVTVSTWDHMVHVYKEQLLPTSQLSRLCSRDLHSVVTSWKSCGCLSRNYFLRHKYSIG